MSDQMSSLPKSRTALHRSLGLRELIFMGLIMIQPTAPMPIFGVVFNEARGHVVSAILVGMLGMMCTAYSYGKMAQVYPSAGSAFTYVGKTLHPAAGYLTGWAMLLDYVLNPVICTIWCSKAAGNILPAVPYAAWVLFFALLFTGLNLRRIQATARTNQVLALAMGVVIVWMLVATWKSLQAPVNWLQPFYDPAQFNWQSFSQGTSIAVLTYIGFDAISTLSEEVHDPRRNILRGTVLVCLIIGVLSAIEVYAAQLVWPVGRPFPDVDTAYVHVAGVAGGPWLFQTMNLTLLIATIGSGAGAMGAGARLLFGMGREGSLPKGLFGYLDPVSQVPSRNVLLIGGLSLMGGFAVSYQLGAEMLNFGAFLGFVGVNMAALRRHGWHPVPAIGMVICGFLWWKLSVLAKIVGGLWLLIGAVYGLASGGFRRPLSVGDVE
jgi:amino acid transporter